MTEDARSHAELAAALRERVLASGVLAPDLRRGILARGGGGSIPVDAPYDELVRQIAGASFRVVDRQVDEVREAAGSQKAAFEVVLTACIGAGLSRWDAASAAIDEATDAPA
ncbi:hypothetical protein GCM10009840_09440 [Pseudolysinimonas kribbensis]|uniref:Uncharacterized protein n=1 Tax=Pseudolysinimonas kribbensis TaxID=433641 RepID=A0ABQ6K402_9MICO|nr:hypothetical protein [Pseudolysinimonas kribbensis]GMA95353.1 hypothetical protein GCM10025881_21770 [Pseudolysinimonas kribbensis]